VQAGVLSSVAFHTNHAIKAAIGTRISNILLGQYAAVSKARFGDTIIYAGLRLPSGIWERISADGGH
jgi:hypothetical protein